MFRHDDGGRRTAPAFRMLNQRPQRRPMQMVEMSVSDQNNIDRRQIANHHSRPPQPFQDEKPTGKVRIDHDVLAANLQEKTGMTNKSHAHLAVRDQNRLARLALPRSDCRMPNQPPKLSGALAHCGAFNGLSQHWHKLLALTYHLVLRIRPAVDGVNSSSVILKSSNC